MVTTAGTRHPSIAVLLPVFNGERYVAEAVHSVLAQTFGDFELIVIDDGSTDGTERVLSRFSDGRLRIIRLAEHRGVVEALNVGIRESKSAFIARMDGDDVCLPPRFERQMSFLSAHPNVDICGTWTRHIGSRRGIRRLPVESEQIRARMFLGSAMDHPAIMMRRTFVDANGLRYRNDFPFAEDLDFLIRAAELGRLANVPEVLLLYRQHGHQVSVVHLRAQAAAHMRIATRQLRALVPDVTEDDASFHARLVLRRIGHADWARAERWLLRLDHANRASRRYDAGAFMAELRRLWFQIHDSGSAMGLRTLQSYWPSELSGIGTVGFLRHARLVVKCSGLRT